MGDDGALTRIAAATSGSVSGAGQGTGTCPVCGKPGKFRFRMGDNGDAVFSCHSGDCTDRQADLGWLGQVQRALSPAGVPVDVWRDDYTAAASPNGQARTQPRQPATEASPAFLLPPAAAPRLPTEGDLRRWQGAVISDPGNCALLDQLLNLSAEQIKQCGIGYDEAADARPWVLPVRDPQSGALVNVIRRDFGDGVPSNEKSWVAPGSVGAYLYAPMGLRPDEPVVLCAGEKDCLAALGHGYNAVAFTGGEGGVPPPERLRALAGREVVIVYDNDAAGQKGAAKVAAGLVGVVGSVRVADLAAAGAPNGADVYDVLHDAAGGTAGLDKAVGAAPPWGGEPEADPAVAAAVSKRWVNELAGRQFQGELIAERNSRARGARSMDGAEFVLDVPPSSPVLWGRGSEVLWADGEGLLLCGNDGVGKSTLAQQLMLARLGVRSEMLTFPVSPADGAVLYVLMDRPAQGRRSMARMFPKDHGEEHRDALKERLRVWLGPLPVNIFGEPDALANWIHQTYGGDVSDVVVDSYKDFGGDLTSDPVGTAINSAMQECLSRGLNWIGLHHQRKASNDNPNPNKISDVYGSRWITAGMGSVFMLVGSPGDARVEMRHLKPPAAEVGPLTVAHDHGIGRSQVLRMARTADEVLDRAGAQGVTASQLATEMWATNDPSETERRRAERILKRKFADDEVVSVGGGRGGKGGSRATRYVLRQHAEGERG